VDQIFIEGPPQTPAGDKWFFDGELLEKLEEHGVETLPINIRELVNSPEGVDSESIYGYANDHSWYLVDSLKQVRTCKLHFH
jgi:hypothetical protein